MPPVHIAEAGVDRLPDIEHLTRALHEHHRTVDPGIPGIPPRDADASWAIRRGRYEAWLTEPDSFLLLAEEDGAERPIGYALVSFHDRDDSHTTGDRFAELQSLVVEPAVVAVAWAPTSCTRCIGRCVDAASGRW